MTKSAPQEPPEPVATGGPELLGTIDRGAISPSTLPPTSTIFLGYFLSQYACTYVQAHTYRAMEYFWKHISFYTVVNSAPPEALTSVAPLGEYIWHGRRSSEPQSMKEAVSSILTPPTLEKPLVSDIFPPEFPYLRNNITSEICEIISTHACMHAKFNRQQNVSKVDFTCILLCMEMRFHEYGISFTQHATTNWRRVPGNLEISEISLRQGVDKIN